MLVTLSGIVMEVRLIQPLNAEGPIFVTLAGISMDSRLLQSTNAHCPILVTPEDMITFLILYLL